MVSLGSSHEMRHEEKKIAQGRKTSEKRNFGCGKPALVLHDNNNSLKFKEKWFSRMRKPVEGPLKLSTCPIDLQGSFFRVDYPQ